ncbi:MAG: hypothetical protein JWL89_39, partial [Candidatus Saccharibacteria bacterium]|nr:hypothetical protein [Candidatus Saccharibacteria bacterium]
MDPQTNPQPATPPVKAVSPPQVPESWPGAFGIYKFSKEVVKPNLGALIAVYVLLIALSIAVEILFKHDGTVYALIYNIVSALLSAFFTGATVCLWLAGVKGQKMSFSEAAKSAMAHLLNLFVLAILTYLALGLSLILLIIPFFFVLPRISLAAYYLIDKNLGPVDALKASWDETKGHA